MDQNAIRQQLQAEATRRFSGQPSSNVATQPNPSASQPTNPPPNPLAGASTGNPPMPTQENPFAGAIGAMEGSMPLKGGTAIERALIKRLEQYPPA